MLDRMRDNLEVLKWFAFAWWVLPDVGIRKKLACMRLWGRDNSLSESDRAWALAFLGLPPDWRYDGPALEDLTRQMMLQSWGNRSRVLKIVGACFWLVERGGVTLAQLVGWEEVSPPPLVGYRLPPPPQPAPRRYRPLEPDGDDR